MEPWNCEIATLPEAIADRLTGPADAPATDATADGPPTRVPRRPIARKRHQRYAQTALGREARNVTDAPEGTRNETLNTAAFNLGQLVGPGLLDRPTVEDTLAEAARACGLTDAEARKTIASGLAGGLAKPRDLSTLDDDAQGRPDGGPKPTALRPGLHITDDGEVVEQGLDQFARDVLDHLPVDALYRKDNLVGELVGSPGHRQWERLAPAAIANLTDDHIEVCKWVQSRQDKDRQVCIFTGTTQAYGDNVVVEARRHPRVRDLDLYVSYPVYGPDFERIPAGYHAGYFYDEPDDLRGLAPETDIERIDARLRDLVVDFPFVGEADRQNFIGLLLTPLVAPALEGNRPLHLIHATLERTGKSKLAEEVLGGIILGRPTPSAQLAEREEEREKRITAALMEGQTILHLDNLPERVDSRSLASLLTSSTYQGRILGESKQPTFANYMTLVGSGNNVTGSGEIAKRMVPICLQARTSRPEARRDFHHPRLRAYVRDNRRDLLAALLGMIENWRAAGQPLHPHNLGGFEHWSGVVGGILNINGLRAWRTNEDDWRRQADPDAAEMEAFVEAWFETYGHGEVSPGGLLAMSRDLGLFDYLDSMKSPSTAFGKRLQRHRDTPVGRWYIRHDRRGNRPAYHLQDIPQAAEGDLL